MKFLLILGLVIVLVTSFLVSNMMPASAQSAKTYGCTSARPCNYQVCGDHICAPGEFAQMKAQNNQAQRGNNTSSTPQSMPSGNMTTTTQSTPTIIAGVATYEDMASDGTTVIVRTGHPISGQPMSLGIGFFGSNRNAIPNQNYAIIITQDNSTVLSKSNAYANSGIDTLTTSPLSSSDPINIQVTLNGVGPSTADPSTWTGVKGEVLSFSQGPMATTSNMTVTTSNMTVTTPASNNATVPEFGPVASIVLAIAVISVVIATKTRVIPRF